MLYFELVMSGYVPYQELKTASTASFRVGEIPTRGVRMQKVSVIIPTYNRAQLLQEAVASALKQTSPVHEIIIVDDGSTDETAKVVSSMPSPVCYIHQQNSGLSAARNRGAAIATGEYLAFLDSDDLWEPEKLEIQLAVLQSYNDIRWCVTNCVIIDFDGTVSRHRLGFEGLFSMFADIGISAHTFFAQSLEKVTVEVGGEAIPAFVGDMFGPLFHGNFCSPVSLLIHRELWDHMGGFDELFQVAEETEFFHRLAGMAPGAIVMTPLIRVRQGHDSIISSKNTIRLIRNALVSIDRAAERRKKLTAGEQVAFVEGKQRLLERLAWAHLTNLDGKETRKVISSISPSSRWRLRIVMIYLASFFPSPILHLLHQSKRFFQHVNRMIHSEA
jgi:GT2 family glycosyltransferase